MNFKIGNGYDVHRLAENRKLILGGVEIAHTKGLLGHSDSDVLVHAIMDALLGASGLGDIGMHFPDTSAEYKDISSIILLRKVDDLLHKNNFKIGNLDCVIVAQKPKLAKYFPEMKKNVAESLHINPACVNIKATTEEGLGFTGAEEGIAAWAVCLLEQRRIYENLKNL
ncbi:MAG: 2-C-methyl-D-erythritol 2,4-cyclodiphosphate synthase [Clostridiales bacterium]|jgi:2-C-methyl-D-erythritol 2,4-cyclodiphosphate synthase|nr:2-C-methyl-D-erythritol 2,4-cyclodiphosphate synthase [Clostridiales bacterium]